MVSYTLTAILDSACMHHLSVWGKNENHVDMFADVTAGQVTVINPHDGAEKSPQQGIKKVA